MATKSISQLDTQATANETDLFEVAIVDANSASGYASKKESAAAIADAIVGKYQYPLRLTETTSKTISGAINEIAGEVAGIKDLEGSASGDIATFVDGSDNPLKELEISIVAVQSGTGDPSPDNVRPISGFNAVNVGDISDTEKVQYFKGLLDGTYGFVNLGSLEYTKHDVTQGTLFRGAVSNIKLVSNSSIVPNIICEKYRTSSQSGRENLTISMPVNGGKVDIIDNNYTDKDTFKTAMNGVYLIYELATPTTPTITLTEFNMLVSAFGLQGWLVQITMPTEVGTVYGGTLDVETGVLTVTHANIASYDGETINEPWISSMDVYSAGATPTTGAQVVYPLTTPVTYQLTPTEIRSLLGQNNIWADCGAITELKYTRDLNLCINDIIARIEALESANSSRSLSLSPTLTKSLTSDSDTAEGKTEETEEETKEEAQKNER